MIIIHGKPNKLTLVLERSYEFQCSLKRSLSFLYIASPQQGDLRLSGPPSGQGAGSGTRTRNRRVPADLRADSQATVLPTPPPLKHSTMSI
ncbi:hypothetical protein PoB_001989100 [Plakobranchus ocellatus]|uniref:Uncharacterized protein n=1 Tax=Plakobranchus ocellatus TaxID=259542 RepID=A0AAV3ZFI0_9GAST|nr:hypothetical protein PoB_001989100 [Plakobranchus ocellatus]